MATIKQNKWQGSIYVMSIDLPHYLYSVVKKRHYYCFDSVLSNSINTFPHTYAYSRLLIPPIESCVMNMYRNCFKTAQSIYSTAQYIQYFSVIIQIGRL